MGPEVAKAAEPSRDYATQSIGGKAAKEAEHLRKEAEQLHREVRNWRASRPVIEPPPPLPRQAPGALASAPPVAIGVTGRENAAGFDSVHLGDVAGEMISDPTVPHV